jgi:hypothetical protein
MLFQIVSLLFLMVHTGLWFTSAQSNSCPLRRSHGSLFTSLTFSFVSLRG